MSTFPEWKWEDTFLPSRLSFAVVREKSNWKQRNTVSCQRMGEDRFTGKTRTKTLVVFIFHVKILTTYVYPFWLHISNVVLWCKGTRVVGNQSGWLYKYMHALLLRVHAQRSPKYDSFSILIHLCSCIYNTHLFLRWLISILKCWHFEEWFWSVWKQESQNVWTVRGKLFPYLHFWGLECLSLANNWA